MLATRLDKTKSISLIEISAKFAFPFNFGVIGLPLIVTRPFAVIFELFPNPGIGNDTFFGTDILIFKFGLARFFIPPSNVAIRSPPANMPEFSRVAVSFSSFISV